MVHRVIYFTVPLKKKSRFICSSTANILIKFSSLTLYLYTAAHSESNAHGLLSGSEKIKKNKDLFTFLVNSYRNTSRRDFTQCCAAEAVVLLVWWNSRVATTSIFHFICSAPRVSCPQKIFPYSNNIWFLIRHVYGNNNVFSQCKSDRNKSVLCFERATVFPLYYNAIVVQENSQWCVDDSKKKVNFESKFVPRSMITFMRHFNIF